jgi:hypothetical protein
MYQQCSKHKRNVNRKHITSMHSDKTLVQHYHTVYQVSVKEYQIENPDSRSHNSYHLPVIIIDAIL